VPNLEVKRTTIDLLCDFPPGTERARKFRHRSSVECQDTAPLRFLPIKRRRFAEKSWKLSSQFVPTELWPPTYPLFLKRDPECASKLSWHSGRDFDVQAIRLLFEVHVSGRTEECNRRHLHAGLSRVESQGTYHRLFSKRRFEFNGIQRVSLCSKTIVVRGIRHRICIVKGAFDNFRRTFPEDLPRVSFVDRLAIDSQPSADVSQDLLSLIGDGPIRAWSNIQK
jgi:hypothetical protein